MQANEHLHEADRWLDVAREKAEDNEWEAVVAFSALASAYAAVARASAAVDEAARRSP
jgi:hypothetical protein